MVLAVVVMAMKIEMVAMMKMMMMMMTMLMMMVIAMTTMMMFVRTTVVVLDNDSADDVGANDANAAGEGMHVHDVSDPDPMAT